MNWCTSPFKEVSTFWCRIHWAKHPPCLLALLGSLRTPICGLQIHRQTFHTFSRVNCFQITVASAQLIKSLWITKNCIFVENQLVEIQNCCWSFMGNIWGIVTQILILILNWQSKQLSRWNVKGYIPYGFDYFNSTINFILQYKYHVRRSKEANTSWSKMYHNKWSHHAEY